VRGALRSLSTVLIVAGVLLIADAIVAVTWQEPVSAFLAQRSQSRLADQLDELRERPPTRVDEKALASLPTQSRRIKYAARQLRRQTPAGGALGRIVLTSLDKDFVMVDGDDPASLRKGPGIYPDTPMPGEGGTTGIAGHRTTYLAPFRDIDSLERGDRIELEMPYGRFTYVVQGTEIVAPDDLSVIEPVGYERIVLTACHPLYSAAERIVAYAKLAKVDPARRISDAAAR
jgi:sortase A